MTAPLQNTIKVTASDYADYAKVDMDKELHGLGEVINEMQLHLEEFRSLLEMAKGDKSVTENVPRMLALQPQLKTLCKRIDALNLFVSKANIHLTALETKMEIAESELGSADNKLAVLNPFTFFKKSPDSPTSSIVKSNSANQSHEPFNIDDYFDNN